MSIEVDGCSVEFARVILRVIGYRTEYPWLKIAGNRPKLLDE